MKTAIAGIPFIPVRSEPFSHSEMLTQLLFGELFSVLEHYGKDWHKIKCQDDGYEGWVSLAKLNYPDKSFLKSYKEENAVYSSGIFQICGSKNSFFHLGFGSRLPLYNNNVFFIGNEEYSMRGEVAIADKNLSNANLVSMALSLAGTPYLWGGKSSFGIDCSGLIQTLFKIRDIFLPRDAYRQEELGEPVLFRKEQEGDLAYFAGETGKVVHVGILLGNNRILHASGTVRIDKFDSKGIFNGDTGKYSHKLFSIKRL